MAFKFNGNTPKQIIYNGLNVAKLVYNNVEAWVQRILYTITGVPPLTANKSFGEPLVDYKIYGNSEQRNLPSEYQEVEYLQNTGKEFIDTGVVPSGQGMKFETKFRYDTWASYAGFYGNYVNEDTEAVRLILQASDNDKGYVTHMTKAGSSTALDVPKGRINTITDTYSYMIVNGVRTNKTYWISGITNETPIALFNNKINSVRSDDIGLKIYYQKIWDNDVLLRYFVPCYRKSDNKPGMYDLVNGVFYTNSGTGEFTLGNDVTTPAPDRRIEIKSVGDKTINLYDKKNMLRRAAYISENSNRLLASSDSTSFLIPCEPNKTYAISIDFEEYEDSIFRTGYITNTDPDTDIRSDVYDYDYNKGVYHIVNTGTGATYIVVQISTAYYPEATEKLQVQEGNVVTNYEPFGYKIPINANNTTTNIYLDEPLRKIGNYTDYIDFSNSKVVRNIGEYKFDGTENWLKYNVSYNLFYTNNLVSNVKTGISTLLNDNSHFEVTNVSSFAGNDNKARFGIDGNGNIFSSNYYISYNEKTSVQEFADWLSEQNRIGNPVKIDYVLNTPIEQSIILPVILTNVGNNTIDVDADVKPSDMEIQYEGTKF